MGWTQAELAAALGVSKRTATRMEGGRSTLDAHDTVKLARHVHPVDRDLAAELLALVGQTLRSAGFETPAPPPPSAPAPPAPPPPHAVALPPPPAPVEVLTALVEGIVCAAADAADTSPKSVRASVLLVLRKASEIGLDLRAVARAGLLHAPAAVQESAPAVPEASGDVAAPD
jgi:DNA-binding XRE family transcriptional regulator